MAAPEEEMAPSEAPVRAKGTPWGKISAALLAILIIVAAVGAYYAATRPTVGPGPTVTCPTGYTYNSETGNCDPNDLLSPTAVASADRETVAIGEEVTFTGTASTDNVGVTAWTWNFGDGTLGAGGTAKKVYGFSGQYIVSLRAADALGNADINDENLIRIRVLERPVVASNESAPVVVLAVDNDVIRPGSSVFFDGKSSWIWRWGPSGLREVCTDCSEFTQDTTAMTYAWNFGDGATGTGVNGTHKYDVTGTYGARLVATGYNGVTTVVYRTIHVLPAAIPFPSVKNPDTIVRATFGEVANLDPARAYDSSSGEVLDQVYEKLVFYDRDSLTVFRPVLSTNVPTKADGTISADGLEYRFHIRQGVKFHNGNALTASDVEYSFERNLISDFTGGPMWLLMEVAIAPGTGAFDRTDPVAVQRVQDFVRVEGNDVVFSLTFAFPPFLSLVATWGSWIVDKETSIARGGWPQTFDAATLARYNDHLELGMNDVAIGTGPYVLDSWDFGVQVVLKKNPNYWNAARNPDAVSTVIIKKVVEPGTLLLLLQNGDADFAEIQEPQKPQVQALQQQGLVTIVEGLPNLVIVYSGINQAIASTSPYGGVLKAAGTLGEDGIPVDFFTDVHVRRGLAYCVDYSTLISQTLRGNAQQARGPIPEGLQGFDPASPVYTKDSAKALAEFQQAWGDQLTTTGFTFEVLYNEGNIVRQTAAQMISDCVGSLNAKFHTSVRGVPWATYLGALIANEWTVGTIGWGADYADAHNFAQPFMDGRSGAFAAFLGYNNVTVQQKIDEGVTETNPTVREQIYREIQSAAYFDVPGIFLYQSNTFTVYRSWINGWYFNNILGESTYFFDYTKG